MRAIILASAVAALLGSYGADANLGGARANDPVQRINDVAALNAAQANLDPSRSFRPRSARRLSVVSPSADAVGSMSGVSSDHPVRTRIETCQGLEVTINSFGGGDWGREIDPVCDEAEPVTDESHRVAQ
ncbi:MAG: hypothetical protein ACN4GT_01385 [Gammaproteobacteria bacterium]